PKGQPTIIEKNGTRKGLNIIGATEVLRDFYFLYEKYKKGTKDSISICATEIISFLEKLLEYDHQRGIEKTFVLLDNASIHRADLVKKFVRKNKDHLFLLFQPPYSPELNPQENMWNWMKKFLSNKSAYTSIEELSNQLKIFSDYANSNPEKIKQRAGARNYFG
ncbi:transposase, partial [Orenia metallireducens]|uniref:transposase n=2 Tax=Orenia metallireducens TaxID=1413210 RepID=UPI0011469DB1